MVALFLPGNDLFHTVHWFVLRLLYLLVNRLVLSPLLVTHSILNVLYNSNPMRNCLLH